MMIKICGITSREDALAAVAAGCDALGFNFYSGSPRCVTPAAAAAIGRDLDVLLVGVFVNESPARVAAIAAEAGLDIVQLHGDENPSDYAPLKTWKAFRVTPDWQPVETTADAILLDGPFPGSGTSFDWSLASRVFSKLILAGGLAPDNVADAVRQVRPWGVDACSRLEISPGIKDHDKVRRFIEAARMVSL